MERQVHSVFISFLLIYSKPSPPGSSKNRQAIQEHPDAFMRLLQEATGGALQPQATRGFQGFQGSLAQDEMFF